MKTKLGFIALVILVVPSLVSAQVNVRDKERYLVKPGDNLMRVAVLNRTNQPLAGLKLQFAIDQPSWFQAEAVETFDLGVKRPVILELPFQITASGTLHEAATLELLSGDELLGNVAVFFDLQTVSGRAAGSTFSEPTVSKKAGAAGEVVESVSIPSEYALYQNRPNPFNPTTVIQYDLPRLEWVVLKVYDALGREVRTLVNGYNPAGRHLVSWDGKNNDGQSLSSGIYIYRLVSGTFVQTRKMVLVR
ncbi:MAG: FlgD immunoglobulin-like domain containing protein [Bacteroidota bacterium]